jgi:protein-disulfide isomerase
MNFISKIFFVAFFTFCFILASFVNGNSIENKSFKRIEIGDANAPVVIYEFLSFSCSHCSTYYLSVFPKLKEKYINTSKVKIVFIDVPFGSDSILLAHALLYHAKDAEQRDQFSKAVFENQRVWVLAEGIESVNKIKMYAKLVGYKESDILATEKDTKLFQWLVEDGKKQLEDNKVKGTPTLIITKNGSKMSLGTKIEGASSFDEVEKVVKSFL